MILFSTSKVKSNFSVYLTRLITIHSSLRFYPGSKDKVLNVVQNALIVFPQPASNITSKVILSNTTVRNFSNNVLFKCRGPLLSTSYRSTRLCVPQSFPNPPLRPKNHYHSINTESTPSEIDQMSPLVGDINNIKKDNTIPSTLSAPTFNNKITVLKNANQKEYTTTINVNSTSDQFNNEQMLEELKKRALIKNDDGKTAVTILNKNNQSVVVGESKNNVKLSQVGQAYYEKYIKSKEPISPQTSPLPNIKNLADAKIGICIPPQSGSETLIEIGKHKHLLLADDPENKEYIIVYGYLTSKKDPALFLSNKQFKAFQKEKEKESSLNKKTQQFVAFNIPHRIKKDSLVFVKWDKEYLKTISDDSWEAIETQIKTNWNKGIIDFSINGITKEDALLICKEYDKVAAQQEGKHPLTADQVKINEEHKKIQCEKNKAKKQQNNENEVDSKHD